MAQATRFGTEILTPQEVTGVRLNDHYKVLTLADGSEVSCHALLVATGVQYRKLDAPGVEALTGAGIYYGAAMTEALSTKGQDVFIVGGGNSAGQAAMYLSGFARQVTILVRGHGLAESMSQYLIDQIGATPNIAVQTRVSVTAAHGTATPRRLRAASGVHRRHQRRHRAHPRPCTAAALFIFIGAPRAPSGWATWWSATEPASSPPAPNCCATASAPRVEPGTRSVLAGEQRARHLCGRRRARPVGEAHRVGRGRGLHGGAVRPPVPGEPVM